MAHKWIEPVTLVLLAPCSSQPVWTVFLCRLSACRWVFLCCWKASYNNSYAFRDSKIPSLVAEPGITNDTSFTNSSTCGTVQFADVGLKHSISRPPMEGCVVLHGAKQKVTGLGIFDNFLWLPGFFGGTEPMMRSVDLKIVRWPGFFTNFLKCCHYCHRLRFWNTLISLSLKGK